MRRTIAFPLLLALITLAVFHGTTRYGFVGYDDSIHVYENKRLLPGSGQDLQRFWTKPYKNLYIPLTYTLWYAQARIGTPPDTRGPASIVDPRVFHAANLLAHVLTVLVVYLFLRLLLGSTWGAFGGALLFAIHPVQTESVAWISEFKGLLSGFFSVAALWLYAVFSRQAPGDSARYRIYSAALLCLLLALLSKPSAVVLPVLAGIISISLFARPLRTTILELTPWFVVAIPIVLITRYAQPAAGLEFTPSLWERVLVAGDSISFYAAKILAPVTLVPDYGRAPQRVLEQDWSLFTGIAPWLTIGAILWRWRSRELRTGLLLFVAALLPVLGFVSFNFQEISTVADRYLHLAMLGPALITGWLLRRFDYRWLHATVLAALAVLAIKAALQAGYWRSTEDLYLHTLEQNPRSWLAHNNLGIHYGKQGEHEKAMFHLRSALRIDPGYSDAWNNLALALVNTGQLPEAIDALQRSVLLDPEDSRTRFNLGRLLQHAGQYDEAAEQYTEALRLRPGMKPALRALRQLDALRAR